MLRIALVFLLSVLAVTVQSIGAASVVGTVTDSTGSVMPGVKITVRNLSTQFVCTGQTNSGGANYIPSMASRSYAVVVEAAGFENYLQTGLILRINESPRVDVQLELGNVTESVE